MNGESEFSSIHFSLLTVFNFFFGPSILPSFQSKDALNKDEHTRCKRLADFNGYQSQSRSDHFNWLTPDFREMSILLKKRVEGDDNINYPEVGRYFHDLDQIFDEESLQYLFVRQKTQAIKFLNTLKIEDDISHLVSLLEMVDYFLSCFFLITKLMAEGTSKLNENNHDLDLQLKSKTQQENYNYLQKERDEMLEILRETENENLSLKSHIREVERERDDNYLYKSMYHDLDLEISRERNQITRLENQNRDLSNIIESQKRDLLEVKQLLAEAQDKNVHTMSPRNLVLNNTETLYEKFDTVFALPDVENLQTPSDRKRTSVSSSVSTNIEDWLDESVHKPQESKLHSFSKLGSSKSTKSVKKFVFKKQLNKVKGQKFFPNNRSQDTYLHGLDKEKMVNQKCATLTNTRPSYWRLACFHRVMIILLIADTILFDLSFTQMLFHLISFIIFLNIVIIVSFINFLFYHSNLDKSYEIGCAIIMQNLMSLTTISRNISSLCLIKYYYWQIAYKMTMLCANLNNFFFFPNLNNFFFFPNLDYWI